MRSKELKMLPWLALILCLLIPSIGSSQTTPSFRPSCTDSVRALKHVWYRERSRADTLSKALTDTTTKFIQYRYQAAIRVQQAEKSGYKAGEKEGKRIGRRQVLIWETIAIVAGAIIRIFVLKN